MSAADPASGIAREAVARARSNMGVTLTLAHRPAEAVTVLGTAVAISEDLMNQHPGEPTPRANFAYELTNLADAEANLAQAPDTPPAERAGYDRSSCERARRADAILRELALPAPDRGVVTWLAKRLGECAAGRATIRTLSIGR